MSFPDYEGKDYYESDHDDEPLNSQELSTSEPKTHRGTTVDHIPLTPPYRNRTSRNRIHNCQ